MSQLNDIRAIPTRGQYLTRASEFIEGVDAIQDSGLSAREFQAQALTSSVKQFGLDIPDPGTLSFALAFNPADPVHEEIKADSESGEEAAYIWTIFGAKKNELYTADGAEIGTTKLSSVAGGSAEGAGVVSEISGSAPQPGDYLIPSAGETLIVVKKNYALTKIGLVLKKKGGGNITAVAAEKSYQVEAPALQLKFNARVQALSTAGGEGFFSGRCTLRITGGTSYVIGTPDIT